MPPHAAIHAPDITDGLQHAVHDFESSSAATQASAALLDAYTRLHTTFRDKTLNPLNLNPLDFLSLPALRSAALAYAAFGDARHAFVELAGSPWNLVIGRLLDIFGPRTLLSRKFIRDLRDMTAAAPALAWSQALAAIQKARNDRQRRAQPRKGVSASRDFAPCDIADANKALQINITHRTRPRKRKEPAPDSPEAARINSPGPTRRRTDTSPSPAIESARRTPDSRPRLEDVPVEQPPSPELESEWSGSVGGSNAYDSNADDESPTFQFPLDDADVQVLAQAPRHELPPASPASQPEHSPLHSPALQEEDSTPQREGRRPHSPTAQADDLPSHLQAPPHEHAHPPKSQPTRPRNPPHVDRIPTAKALAQLENGVWLGHESIFQILPIFASPHVCLLEVHRPPRGNETWDNWAQSHHYRLGGCAEVLAPVHLYDESHWVLIHLDVAGARATLYDSSSADATQLQRPGANMEAASRALAKTLGLDWECQEWAFRREEKTAQQLNFHDCGIHVLVATLHIVARALHPVRVDAALWRAFLRSVLCRQMDAVAVGALQPAPAKSGEDLIACHESAAQRHQHCTGLLADAEAISSLVSHIYCCYTKAAREASRLVEQCAGANKKVEARQHMLELLRTAHSADPEHGDEAALAAVQVTLDSAQRSLDVVSRDLDAAQHMVEQRKEQGGALEAAWVIAEELRLQAWRWHLESQQRVDEVAQQLNRVSEYVRRTGRDGLYAAR